jgi:hypothetical protein
MSKNLLLVSVVGALLAVPPAYARDDRLKLSIKEALESPVAQGKVDNSISLYWGNQEFPKPAKVIGTYTANKKTNAFNKSDKEACEINLVSAVIALQHRALSTGGNAVVNIHSYYKRNDFSSTTEYECGAGTFTSGVALTGTVVKVP